MFFRDSEAARVIAALPESVAPAVEFAYITGWRFGEITSLTWAQVDLHGGVVRLDPEMTKNQRGRTFPFAVHPRLAALITTQRERALSLQRRLGRIVPHVFWRGEGEPLGNFRKAWAHACREAGCPGKVRHDFRRTAVRNLVRAGVNEKVAMTITGHLTRRIFDAYNIVSDADLRAAIEKLAERQSR